MQREVKKEDVQELLGFDITDTQFEEALEFAQRKQQNIYKREGRPVTLQHWYLVELTEEYVRSLAFSRYTLDLCRTRHNMEKEHSASCQSAQSDNHIVIVSAL